MEPNPFPINPGPLREDESSCGSKQPQSQPGILLVDDEISVRNTLTRGLGLFGFTVFSASDGHAALEVFRAHRHEIDVILLDVRMPGLDGPQTLAALQNQGLRAPVCFMSGDFAGYSDEVLRAAGAVHLFKKPFPITEIANILLGLIPRP